MRSEWCTVVCLWVYTSRHILKVSMKSLDIAAFVGAYALVNISKTWRKLITGKITRRCNLDAHGCRIATSIIFPLRCICDRMYDMRSTSSVALVLGNMEGLISPVQILLTTLAQGIILNCGIFSPVLFFIGCTYAKQGLRSRIGQQVG